MLFPTHLAAAYVIGRRWDLPLYWVVAGAALPDLIDKPLAMGGATDLYHSIGHSLLCLVALSVAGFAGRKGIALWIGWASHLFLDGFQMSVNGRPEDVRFLAWPLIKHEPAVQLGPVDFLFHALWTPAFYAELAIWGAAAAVYAAKGDDHPSG